MQEARAMTLIEHLTLVEEETRSEINRKHNLVDVMFLVISAIMSGAEGWNDIETHSKIDWLRQHRPFANGIPRRHTVARILRCIVIDTLLEALLCWVNEQRTHQGKPSLPLMARCYAAPFGKCQGCASVGHGLRYRKWAGVKPESNPNKKGKSKPSKICWTFLS